MNKWPVILFVFIIFICETQLCSAADFAIVKAQLSRFRLRTAQQQQLFFGRDVMRVVRHLRQEHLLQSGNGQKQQ